MEFSGSCDPEHPGEICPRRLVRTPATNRFVRWRPAGVWSRIIDALAGAHDAAVQMIDTSIVRMQQHGACFERNQRQSMGRSRGGLTSKIHAVVDCNGLPVRLALGPGEAHDVRLAGKLPSRLKSGSPVQRSKKKGKARQRCPAFLHFVRSIAVALLNLPGRNAGVSSDRLSARSRTRPLRICSCRACDKNSRSDCPRSCDSRGQVPLTARLRPGH